MTDPSYETRLATLAEQYGFSEAAVRHLFDAVTEGGGDMAMFDHDEFRGPGQWMRGGLIMTTTPGDRVLNNAIESLCNRLSALLREQRVQEQPGRKRINPTARAWDTSTAPRQHWWPAEWGEPVASGQADDLAYAFFDDVGRLAIRHAEDVDLYKTAGYCVTGISQIQRGTTEGLVFTTPFGELPLAQLEPCSNGAADAESSATQEQAADESDASGRPREQGSAEILQTIEKLGALHRDGVLTDDEFNTKKQELLKRL